MRHLILLLIPFFLFGCKKPEFTEESCTVKLTINIADSWEHTSSDYIKSTSRKDKKVYGVAAPIAGEIWILGYKDNHGVKPDHLSTLGHEVQHILSEQCPEFADPDAKETFVGHFFGSDW